MDYNDLAQSLKYLDNDDIVELDVSSVKELLKFREEYYYLKKLFARSMHNIKVEVDKWGKF